MGRRGCTGPRTRTAGRRLAPAALLLGLRLPLQRSDRDRRPGGGAPDHPGVAGPRRGTPRSPGCVAVGGGPRRTPLRGDRGPGPRLDQPGHPRRLPRGRGRARRVRRLGVARRRADARHQLLPGSTLQRGHRGDHGPVLRTARADVRVLPDPAVRARLRRARGRRASPSPACHVRGLRAGLRPGCGASRHQAGGHRRPGDRRRRLGLGQHDRRGRRLRRACARSRPHRYRHGMHGGTCDRVADGVSAPAEGRGCVGRERLHPPDRGGDRRRRGGKRAVEHLPRGVRRHRGHSRPTPRGRGTGPVLDRERRRGRGRNRRNGRSATARRRQAGIRRRRQHRAADRRRRRRPGGGRSLALPARLVRRGRAPPASSRPPAG